MADALGSGPSGLNARGGSSPLARTRIEAVPGKYAGHFLYANRALEYLYYIL